MATRSRRIDFVSELIPPPNTSVRTKPIEYMKHFTFLFLSAVGASLLFTSCGIKPAPAEAAIAASFNPSRNKALIYVYRPARLLGASVNSRVSLDGRSKGELPNGKFMCLETPSGTHQLLAGGRLVHFSAKPGKCDYFRVDVSAESQGSMISGPAVMPILAFHFQGNQVEESEARNALKKTSQVAVQDSPSTSNIKIIAE